MIRKKVTFEIEGGEVSLHKISDQERQELEGFLKEAPLDFYLLRELMRLRTRIDEEFPVQWVNKYEFALDTTRTNEKLNQFPGKPKYLYVKSNTGTVTAKFDSPTESSWSLTTKDQYRFPFDRLYLTFTAQVGKKLVIYISNQQILRSTLA